MCTRISVRIYIYMYIRLFLRGNGRPVCTCVADLSMDVEKYSIVNVNYLTFLWPEVDYLMFRLNGLKFKDNVIK